MSDVWLRIFYQKMDMNDLFMCKLPKIKVLKDLEQ